MTTITIDKELLPMLQELLKSDIQGVYDDPVGAFGSRDDPDDVSRAQEWDRLMRKACEELGLVYDGSTFDEVVAAEATEYEIANFQAFLRGERYEPDDEAD